MKDVLLKVNQLSIDDLSKIMTERLESYDLGGGVTIDFSDFISEESAKNGFEVSSNSLFKVAINTIIDEDLRFEGMIRDLIRHVQNFRKDRS